MIFYFSATGNCKYAAQRIAASTGEAIHSITECVKQQQYHFSSDNGTVGIITPTYAWRLPSIADTKKRNEIAFWLQTGKAVRSKHITDPNQQQNARRHHAACLRANSDCKRYGV